MFSRIMSFCAVGAMLLLLAGPAGAQEKTGPRIPTTYFAVTGVGQSNDGIPPDPYETFSFDLALRDAGIEDFNVVYYTSVLPPESREIPFASAKPFIHHGSVLEAIMAKAGGVKGDTVAAGIGRVWAEDAQGNFIGGFAAEYERIYKDRRISRGQALSDAKAQLHVSLKHELQIRGLKQKGEMTFDVSSLQITKQYGMAIAALGFVGFIHPEPYPVKH